MSGLHVHRFPSPLRYPGGKGKVANYLKLLFLENGFLGYEYVEPYAGGASAAFMLLFDEFASRIHLNDLNRSVYAFWHAVLNRTEDLCRRVSDTRPTMKEWRRQEAVQYAQEPEPLDLAFSTFFLNRTNRSGIILGGVIGGKDQEGPWALDARYNTPQLIQRIQKIARFKNRITLTNCDASVFLSDQLAGAPPKTFVYLDPPYYVKGKGLYESYYETKDHASVASLVRALKVPWIVSYDAVPQVKRLYAGYERVRYSLNYSAQDRYRGSEIMFFSPGLNRPKTPSPARISGKAVDSARLKRAG